MTLFTELDKEYQRVTQQLSDTFNGIAERLVEIIDEHGYEDSQYRISHGGTYESHSISDKLVYIHYRWEDPYDDYQTDTHLQLPLHWIDQYMNDGTLPEDEILKCLQAEKEWNDKHEYDETLRRAIRLGIVSGG